MPYYNNGSLTTSKETVNDSDGWDSQAEWEAYQSASNVEIVNGTVQLAEFTIPDSVVEQYNAQNLFGSDGDSITTWPGEVGTADATGNATLRTSGINGYQALEFGATDDFFTAPIGTYSQVNTIFAVAEANFTDTESNNRTIYAGDSTAQNLNWSAGGKNWALYAGSVVDGSADTSTQLFVGVFDGANSAIREDGTETGAGDAGGADLSGLAIGGMSGGSDLWDGDIGFVEVHDGLPSNGLQTREQEIADMWGVTL